MLENTLERRVAAMRASKKMLSGRRPPTIREWLAVLNASGDLGRDPDFYGDGPVAALEERVATMLGSEAAVFFPTGTMAQQVALRYGADRTGNTTVALHPAGHQEKDERHAYAQVTGLRSVWPTTAPRNATADEIAALGEPVGTVVFELPLREVGFVLPTWDDLVAAVAAARAIGARVHFDGARIWESTPYLAHSLSEVAGLADSTYVSLYKTIRGISGAVLAGTAELAAYAHVWRQRYGGNVFQQWPAALAALAGLDTELPRIPEYVRHAPAVAGALAELPGALVHPNPPHTHQFRLYLPHPAQALNDANLLLAEEDSVWFAGRWTDADVPGLSMVEITVAAAALEWDAEEIVEVGARLLHRLAAER